tara:strand:+ start:1454 stop:1756 length:303 start_codon:yes stop_codon:yes gene_type:complete
MSKKVDKILEDAIENIKDDRQITRELLDDAIKWLSKDEARHQTIGITLSKYVETLQRSNDQLVRIAGIMSKHEDNSNLSESDMDDIYKMIDKEEKKDGDK